MTQETTICAAGPWVSHKMAKWGMQTELLAHAFQPHGTVGVAWMLSKFVTGMAEKAEESGKIVERLEKERADSAERPAFAMVFLDLAMD